MHPRLRRFKRASPYDFLIQLPTGYPGETFWPLLLCLHGVNERGSDVTALEGIPVLAKTGSSDFPFVSVLPQCPAGQFWSTRKLGSLLEQLLENFQTDPDRTYLTGFSMGGHATWNLALAAPFRFAAIAPICGAAEANKAGGLHRVPIWVFHGAKDQTVPLEESQRMVDIIKQFKGKVEFTIYPNSGHDSWTETYNNPALYKWFSGEAGRVETPSVVS